MLVLILVVSVPLSAAEKHGAHRHGTAELNVALQGNDLSIGVTGPAENVLGFEHAPKNESQKQTLQRTKQLLDKPQNLFALPSAAGCEPQPARVEIELPTPGSRETHSEFEAEYRWRCSAPAELRHIDVKLFGTFTRLKQLRAQIATSEGQRSATLTPGAPRLTLR